MSYDHWKQTPPSEASSAPTEREPETCLPFCRDCCRFIAFGAHSTPHGTSCDPCWRWRQARGLEFDPRSKSQIEAAERKGAA